MCSVRVFSQGGGGAYMSCTLHVDMCICVTIEFNHIRAFMCRLHV